MNTLILIGLPAAGKTTLSQMFAKHSGKAWVATDPLFRTYRAMPEDSIAEGSDIMRNFLSSTEKRFPNRYAAIKCLAQVDPQDPQKRSFLRDSAVFRDQGEDVFRLFEIEMIGWLNKTGKFENAIPDITSSALLYPENRDVFSPENGYSFVLLDPSHDTIVDRLVKGYAMHEKLSEAAGEPKNVRGGYEKAARKALAANPELSKDVVVREALEMLSLQHRSERMDLYRQLQSHTVTVGQDETPAQTLQSIITITDLSKTRPKPGSEFNL